MNAWLYFSYVIPFRSEFKRLISLADGESVHSVLEEWDLWANRIIKYDGLEMPNRKQLRNLIDKHETCVSNEIKGLFIIIIISRNINYILHA